VLPLLYLTAWTLIAAATGRKMGRVLGVTPRSTAEEAAVSIGLGYGAWAYGVLALGLTGLLSRPALVAFLVALALWSRRDLPAVLRWLPPRPAAGRGPSRATWFIIGLIVVAALANLIAALAPVTAADAMAYHLGAPRLWLEAHRITEIPWLWATYQPLNMEMLFLAGLGLQGDGLASLVAWLFGLLPVMGLVALSRHLRSPAPWVAAGIYYLSVLVAKQSTEQMVDAGVAFFTLMAVHALLNALAEKDVRWFSVAGAFAGMAAGSKYLGAPIPALLLVAIVILQRRERWWTAALRFVLPAAALVLPWLLRSFLQTGDPFYPFLTALQGHEGLRDALTGLTGRYGRGRGLVDAVATPVRLIFLGKAFSGGEILGPLFLSLMPFSMWHLRRREVRLLWYVVVGYGTLWFLGSQQARFLLPVVPLAAALCAVGLRALEEVGGGLRLTARFILAGALISGTLGTIVFDAPALPVVLGRQSRQAYLSQNAIFYEDFDWINRTLPAGTRLLLTVRTGYYLRRPFVGLAPWNSNDELRALLARERISHVFCTEKDCDAVRAHLIAVRVIREGQSRGPLNRRLMARTEPRTYVLEIVR